MEEFLSVVNPVASVVNPVASAIGYVVMMIAGTWLLIGAVLATVVTVFSPFLLSMDQDLATYDTRTFLIWIGVVMAYPFRCIAVFIEMIYVMPFAVPIAFVTAFRVAVKQCYTEVQTMKNGD